MYTKLIIMIRLVPFLLLFILFNTGLAAQAVPAEKKTVTESPKITIKAKKRSSELSTANGKTSVASTIVLKGQSTPGKDVNTQKASEIIRIDYANMPATVQARINANKASGKFLLEGVAKAFTVEIKNCMTETDQLKTLSFLRQRKDFIRSELISAGVVKITVEPAFDSIELKEAMLSQGISFNFLYRVYLLKN